MNFYKSFLFQKSLELLNINAHVGRGVWTLDWIFFSFWIRLCYVMQIWKSERKKKLKTWYYAVPTCKSLSWKWVLNYRQLDLSCIYIGMRQVVIATVNFEVDIDLLIKGSRHFFKHSAENILRQDIWNWHVVFSLSIYYSIIAFNSWLLPNQVW